jgi:hypothetical protein
MIHICTQIKGANMKNDFITLVVASAIVYSTLPAFAQQQLSNNQPVTKVSTAVETRIQAKMKLDFKKGLIDATQLASLQRDFDGILSKEDSLKSRGQADGMTSGGNSKIVDELSAFEARLDKLAGVSTTAGAEAANGPKVNKNNANLSSVAPTR